MIRILKALTLAAGLMLAVAIAPPVSANPPTVDVPLSAEPAPLSANPLQAVTVWTVYPPTCSAVASGSGPVCLERAEVWACPAALSHGAVLRAAPAYNDFRALAYRSTHCKMESSAVVAAASWPPTAGQVIATAVPAPTPTADPCPDGGVPTDLPGIGVVCVFTTDGVQPAEGPPPAQIAFTGTETTAAAMLGLGLVSTGAAVLGVRRRMFGDDVGELS